MIGHEYDNGVFEISIILKRGKDLADLLVDEGDVGSIMLPESEQLCFRRSFMPLHGVGMPLHHSAAIRFMIRRLSGKLFVGDERNRDVSVFVKVQETSGRVVRWVRARKSDLQEERRVRFACFNSPLCHCAYKCIRMEFFFQRPFECT